VSQNTEKNAVNGRLPETDVQEVEEEKDLYDELIEAMNEGNEETDSKK
jgi:hypothetical protein